MWHLRTRLGTFWVVPIAETKNQFYLGINDQELGLYTDVEKAAQDVHDQSTGYYKWDAEAHIRAPLHISEWAEGEPQNWRPN